MCFNQEEKIDFDNSNENENMIENGEEILAQLYQNNKKDNYSSIDLIDNEKLYNSLNTNTTIYAENEGFSISFFPNNNNEENDKVNNKALTKESIEILVKFISKESLKISENNFLESNLNKKINDIKDIKKNLQFLENKMNHFFKKSFMRKNNIKQINLNISDDETIKYEKVKNKSIQIIQIKNII